MSWFRKQSAKEIARNVAEKAERWERAAEAARLADLITKAQTGARIREASAADLTGSDLSSAAGFEFQQPTGFETTNFETRQPIHPDTLSALLLAGNAMAEWLLEERPEGKDQTDRAPGWCLMCGHRGKMNEPGDHGIGCAVGLWLMSKPK
jgi:hypothetical protein